MSIYIKRHIKKNGDEAWYCLLKTWDIELKREVGKHISREQSGVVLGIPGTLTYKEAKERAKQLNAQSKLKYHADRRAKIADRLKTERTEALAFLPEIDIAEFETKVLAVKFLGAEVWDPKHKTAVKWRAALKTMRHVKLDPSEWAEKPFVFYTYFIQKKFSPSYVERIIHFMNLYGYFYCRKYKTPFAPIPPLKGVLRQKQTHAYSTNPERRHKADRITPAELEAQKSNLGEERYNWVFLSLWLGLRPEEVDSLKNPHNSHPHFFEIQDDTPVLVIYQSKLLNTVDESERWKRIPILYEQQEEAVKIIASGKFERPLPKTLQLHLKKAHADTYSGRKSYADLMRSLGQDLEDIFGWMGHKTIERTWKDYKSRKIIHFKKPPKKQS